MPNIDRQALSAHKWIWVNLRIGALSFGSSGRILLYQDAIVIENKWLSEREFQEALTLAQVLPGPNLVNLAAYLGFQLAGPMASALGILALVLPGALLIIGMLKVIPISNPSVALLFQGFSLASTVIFFVFIAGLIKGLSATSLAQEKASFAKQIARASIAITAAALSLFHLPLIPVLLAGILVCAAVEFGGLR